MTLPSANTILQDHGSPYRIQRNDRPAPRWRIQLGDKHGALTFTTLEDAVRWGLHAAPRPEVTP
jgi:hypothetical protein